MDQDEYLQRLAALHEEWAKTARVIVDPRYSNNDPSQYAEGIEATTPLAEDDDVFIAKANALLREYNRSQGRPGKGGRQR